MASRLFYLKYKLFMFLSKHFHFYINNNNNNNNNNLFYYYLSMLIHTSVFTTYGVSALCGSETDSQTWL